MYCTDRSCCMSSTLVNSSSLLLFCIFTMSIARASVFDISRVLTENGLCAGVVDKLADKTLLPARNLSRNMSR